MPGGWTAGTRERYANDLGDPRALVAVTAKLEPVEVRPGPGRVDARPGQCRYVRQWVAVKIRWSLKMDPAEKRSLLAQAALCPNTLITVRRASLVRAASTATTTTDTVTGSTGLDRRFSVLL